MKEIVLPAKIENIPAATDFVNAALEDADCPMKAQMQIDVVIDELFGNIAQYAYPDGTGDVKVGIDVTDNAATLIFTDRGTPYNPLERKDPDTDAAIEDRDVGGLGIFLVKKTMDDVKYEFSNGKNILTIIKRL